MKLILNVCFLLIAISYIACEEVDIQTSDLIKKLELSQNEVLADGAAVVEVSATLNPDAGEDGDSRTITFSTSRGTFVASKMDELNLSAEETLDEELVARAELSVPNIAGNITVKAEIANYSDTIVLKVTPSLPSRIEVSAGAFSVLNNFAEEVLVTGQLFNEKNGKVSIGQEVIFEDFYPDGETRVGGKFRDIKSESNAESQVSMLYTPGNIAGDTSIVIKISLLNDLTINGEVEIFVKTEK